MIDWEQLLISNGIDYITSGENVKKGNINIPCPFCLDDPSHHLGISQTKQAWGCWRDSDHRGRRPHRLLSKLLGMSYQEVERLLGSTTIVPDGFETFASGISDSYQRKEVEEKEENVHLPASFTYITKQVGTYRNIRYWRHVSYLCDRGVSLECASYFKLMYCDDQYQKWSGRIIVPFFEDGKIVTWNARAIKEWKQPRYLAATSDGNNSMRTTDVVFNLDNIDDSISLLVVTEGVFDAINVHWCGKDNGIGAVAINTTSISERQLFRMINRLERRKIDLLIALDRVARKQSLLIQGELSAFARVQTYAYNIDYDDPAELPRTEVIRMRELL